VISSRLLQQIGRAFGQTGSENIEAIIAEEQKLYWQNRGSDLHGHEAEVWSVAFSPDGTRLVTGSGDKTARLWRILPVGQELINYARALVPRN
jgi:WD40 repeat protein